MPSLFFADLVREKSQSSGSGPMVLAGALPGHRRFGDVVPPGAAFHYAIANLARAAEWEVGRGSLDAQGRLVRDAVAASSNNGVAVAFSPGVKTIALTVGAGWFGAQEAAGDTLASIAAEVAALTGTVAANTAGVAALNSSVTGLTSAVAGKQPISTGLPAATSLTASDSITIRRASDWANVPASALVHQRASGAFSCAGNLGIGESEPAKRLVVKGQSALDGSAPVAIEISDTQPGSPSWGTDAAFAAVQFRSADGSVVGPGVRAQIAATMPVTHGGITDLRLSASGAALLDRSVVLEGSGRLRPGADNLQPLGWASLRWSVVYAASGAINTSDARDKAWRSAMDAAERRAARRMVRALGFFRWRDAVAEKGDSARQHFGIEAQTAWRIMAEEGLVDPIGTDGRPGRAPYAFLCFDEWTEADGTARTRFGVRHDQLALFLIAAMVPQRRAPC